MARLPSKAAPFYDNTTWSLLVQAVRERDTAEVKRVLALGVDLAGPAEPKVGQESWILLVAAREECLEILELLLKVVPDEVRERQWAAVVHEVMMADWLPAVKLLQRFGEVSPLVPLSVDHTTPLESAAAGHGLGLSNKREVFEHFLVEGVAWHPLLSSRVVRKLIYSAPCEVLAKAIQGGLVLDPWLDSEGPHPFRTLGRWYGRYRDEGGRQAEHTHSWIVALTQAGLAWPEEPQKADLQDAKALHEHVLLTQSLATCPGQSGARPRL